MADELPISGTAAPAVGQPAQAAPAAGQAAQQATTDGQPAQKPGLSVQDILAAARPQRSPEDELELVKQQYGASSAEGKRLAAKLKVIQERLAEQGIEIAESKDGQVAGFKANEKFSKDLASLNPDELTLTAKEKELLNEDPEKAVKSLVARLDGRYRQAFTRAAPTIEKVVEPITAEKLQGVHKFLASRKDFDGSPLYPEYEKDAPIIDQLIADMPEGVRNAFAGNEAHLVQLQHANLVAIRARLDAQAQRKAALAASKSETAKKEAAVGVQGHGKVVIQDGTTAGDFLKTLRG